MASGSVALARELLAFNTINPPGNEAACAHHLGRLLEAAGLTVRHFEFAKGRTSLVATLSVRNSTTPPIVFTGHLDTVPLGAAPWSHDPFGGEVVGDRLYGRGASDMKGAVAAMVIMSQRLAGLPRRADLVLVFTAGEETSCQGAQHLAETAGALGEAGALVVGEPTGNAPVIAHKGCVRYGITLRGKTAHASMPEQGDNAIHKAAEIVTRLRHFQFGVPSHPLLGSATLNIGTIEGGMNINSVPDRARIGVDIRLLPGQTEARVRQQLLEACGESVEIERLEGAVSVETDPGHPWVREVVGLAGAPPRGAPYFTDASVLTGALGNVPTVILGPGEAEIAHQTDEYCSVAKLERAADLYCRIAESWCGVR